MIDPTWEPQEITNFKGSWSLVEKTDIQYDGALFAKNVRYLPGSVLTRFGVKTVLTINKAITTMWNWLFADPSSGAKNFLVYFSSGVKAVDLTTGVTSADLYAAAGRGAVFANSGSRFISAHFATTGLGADGGRIYGYGVGDDQLFARPILTSEVTLTAPTTTGGFMTPGTRNVAFLMTTRNGFTGRPSPANSGLDVIPVSVTTTSTNNKITVTLTPASVWPAFSGTAEILMTSTVNTARYYIVSSITLAIPGGSSLAVSTTVDISDDELVTGEDATPYFELLTQNASGTAPFFPCGLIESGPRIGYIFKSSDYGQGVAFSDPNNYQALSAARNIFYLPGQLEIVAGCVLDNSIMLIGPNWTYTANDNGDYPVTWSGAQKLDGTIGTICPMGVAVSAARSIGWVVSKNGLYALRGGVYDTRPISYYNAGDWAKINWAIFYDIQVTDDASRKRVSVLAPLTLSGYVTTNGTAITWASGDEFAVAWMSGTTITINGVAKVISSITSPTAGVLTATAGVQTNVTYSVTPTYNTHALTWDYTEGDTAETAKFSLQVFENFNPGAQCVVQNPTSKLLELWYGRTVAGDVFREMNGNDASPYRDGASSPIDSQYETALYPTSPGRSSFIRQNHGAFFRALGSGSMPITCYTIDHASSKSLTAITLSTSPGREYWRATGSSSLTNSECKSYKVSNNRIADAWFQISRILDYTKQYSRQR